MVTVESTWLDMLRYALDRDIDDVSRDHAFVTSFMRANDSDLEDNPADLSRLVTVLTNTYVERFSLNIEQKMIVHGHLTKKTFGLRDIFDLCSDWRAETQWNSNAGPLLPQQTGAATFGITGPYPVRENDSPSVRSMGGPVPQASQALEGAPDCGHC